MSSAVVKRYEPRIGLDLTRSKGLIEPDRAYAASNWQRLFTGSISTRNGFQRLGGGLGGLGLMRHQRIDSVAGADTAEILYAEQRLYRRKTGTITVTYSGAAVAPKLSFRPEGTGYFCRVIDTSLGTLYTYDASSGDVATFVADLNAEADFTATASAGSDTSVDVDTIAQVIEISAISNTLTFYYWEAVPQPESPVTDDIFDPLWSNRTDGRARNLSHVNMNNVTYFGQFNGHIAKYDGQGVYRAGMPEVTTDPSVALTAGAVTGTNYKYITTFIMHDKQGNIVEGVASEASNAVSPSAQGMNVTVQNIDGVSENFYNHYAVSTSNQIGVTTIACDDGSGGNHTIEVGDVIYLIDRGSVTYVTRTITAVTGSSISFSGAVDVNNNDVISANLRIGVYRTKSGGSDYFLVAEIPNDPSNATTVFYDNVTDVNLGAQYLYPVVGAEHAVLPDATAISTKYLAEYRGLLIAAGSWLTPNTVYFSDQDSPEYFPALNNFEILAGGNDEVTGLAAADRFFIVFKNRSCFRITGVLIGGDVVVDQISQSVGCASHHTIQEIVAGGQTHIVFLGPDGVYAITEGGSPREVSISIRPIFAGNEHLPNLVATTELKFSRSVAVNDPYRKLYILYLMDENLTTDSFGQATSRILVWDYGLMDRGQEPMWYEWTNMNMAAGALMDGQELWWQERHHTGVAARYDIYRRTDREDKWTAWDHTTAITSSLSFGFDDFGNKNALKRIKKMRGYSHDTTYGLNNVSHTDTEQFTLTAHLDYEYGEVVTTVSDTLAFNPTATMPRASFTRKKAQAVGVRFAHSTAGERPILNAFELEIGIPDSLNRTHRHKGTHI